MAPREPSHPADVVRRTIPASALPEWPVTIDHVALERLAKDARRTYLQEAVPRWLSTVRAALQAPALARVADRFWNALENADRARRDAWLAKATDVCDLEQRIRVLERQAVRGSW